MKKILLILMLVCMTEPAWALRCPSSVRSSTPYIPEQTCPIGSWYMRWATIGCFENESDKRQFNFFVYNKTYYFCMSLVDTYRYGHGAVCPDVSKSSLPEAERKDVSACNECAGNAIGTPPYDCRCKSGYYYANRDACTPCPTGTTSPEGSKSASDCVASLPANCATGSNGACTKCNTGYSLVSGTCVKNKASCKAPLKLSADGCCCTL